MPVSRHPPIATPPPSSPYPAVERPRTRQQARLEASASARESSPPVPVTPVTRRPAVVNTYAGRRTIATTSRLPSPDPTPPRRIARAGTRATSAAPSASVYSPPSVVETSSSEVFPTLAQLFEGSKKPVQPEEPGEDTRDEADERNDTPAAEPTIDIERLVAIAQDLGKCDGCWCFMGSDCYV